jgi:TonB family protein
MPLRLAFIILCAVSLALSAASIAAHSLVASHAGAANNQPTNIVAQSATVHVAVLDLGATETGARATERLSKRLAAAGVKGATDAGGRGETNASAKGETNASVKGETKAGVNGETRLSLLDRDLARAAARGTGYSGSLNLTLAEARSLGAAIGCDFYLTGDAQTVRRSASERPVYFESYASVFLVSTRTGRLVLWDRPAAEADKPEQSEASLLAELDRRAARYAVAILEAFAREERERFGPHAEEADGVIDLSTDDAAGAHADLREPAPYRRLRPAYTDAASRAEAEATVDALVEIGADGEVGSVEVVRWAGFGLDDSVVSTVRQMHFRPAARGGQPVAVRVLLRYNFRRPPPTK